jgi:hypothetical protein
MLWYSLGGCVGLGRCELNKTPAKSVWAPSYFFRTFILMFLVFFVFRSKEKLEEYLLTTQVFFLKSILVKT